MRPILRLLARLRRDRHGATAVEYGILAGVVALALAAGFVGFGSSVTELYDLPAARDVLE